MTASLSPRVRVFSAEGSPQALVTISVEDNLMRFQFDAGPSRLRVGLLLARRERPMDVSIQPSVLASSLAPSGDGSTDEVGAVSSWLSTFCDRHGLWASTEGDLVRSLTGASFPLLGHVYGHGAATLIEVPRWAAPALAELRPRAAALAALGPAVSRPVIAALAASLLPQDRAPSTPALYPLALAIMGSRVLAPDALARVIRAGTHDRQPDPSTWPSVDDVARFQLLAPWIGAPRVERVLTDAASMLDGARVLSRTAVLLEALPSGVCSRLPHGLVALHERCRELTPIDPRPRAFAREASGRSDQPVTQPRRPRRATVPRQALVAPRTTGTAPRSNAQLIYASAVWRLHGRRADFRLRLVLPRTVDELRSWGQRLHNCLGTFAAAAACGRSVLIGVERDDVLVYCAELAPKSRTIRQFLGPYNRPVPAADAAAVCSVLLAEELIDPRQAGNRPWVDLCRSIAAL